MSSTNKTTNYELSQFIGTDKPAWLSDYNQDMSKIDTAVKNATDTATAASGSATSANTAIGTLSNLTTTDKTSVVAAINEVDTNVGTAQNTANTALNNAGTANTDIAALSAYLDINNFGDFTSATSNNGTISYIDMHYATNSTNSLGKIYGTIDTQSVSAADTTITLSAASPFRPSSRISIKCLGVSTPLNGNISYPVGIDIETDGVIKVRVYVEGNKLNRIVIHPCVLFIKDFGDVNEPQA